MPFDIFDTLFISVSMPIYASFFLRFRHFFSMRFRFMILPLPLITLISDAMPHYFAALRDYCCHACRAAMIRLMILLIRDV